MSTPTKDALAESYQKTMTTMQSELHGLNRLLSRLFHNPFISFVFSLLGSSILRTRALLIGSTASFVALVFFYVYAKLDAYAATGFEPLLAFLVGWAVGFVIDIFLKR